MENSIVKKHYLSSMTPRDLVYELLDKAISNITLAKNAFLNNQFEQANKLLIATQNIFEELRGSLHNNDIASQHAAQLLELLSNSLFLANINRNMLQLDETRQMTERLKITYATQLGKLRFK